MRVFDNIIITDDVVKYLSAVDRKVEPLTFNLKRGMITFKVGDNILTSARSFGRNVKEAVHVLRRLADMGFPVDGNPLLIGRRIALQHMTDLNIQFNVNKTLQTRLDYSPRVLMYSDSDALTIFKEMYYVNSSIPVKKVNTDFVHVDVNSFGALIFKKSLKLPKIIGKFIEKVHNMKYDETDECVRRALKYILVGYINAFLFRESIGLLKLDTYSDKLKRTLIRETLNGSLKNYVVINNEIYTVTRSTVFSNIAQKYYNTAISTIKEYYFMLDGFILFGDDIYTRKENVKQKLINDKIGGLKIIEDNIKLLMGTNLPPVFYGLKLVDNAEHLSGCIESDSCNIVGKREFVEYNGKVYEFIPHYFNNCTNI